MDLILAFITGLTTGGLSCLAVQGGLLASSLAYQIEQDLKLSSETGGAARRFRPRIAQPILLFLLAKLIAYTVLGLLLGALGSVFHLSPVMSAVLLFLVGFFMLGNALRMLNVHPIFRYFVIEPPSPVTRYLRRKSKDGASQATALFMGALTVLIPCGVTQAMMAVALGTGSPLQGAAILFSFILGTTPVFFTIAYFATRLGATVEKYFTRFVAVALLILGLVSVNSGLNLVGSPYSFTNLYQSLRGGATGVIDPPAGQAGYEIHVTENGYSPDVLHLPANKPVELTWVTDHTTSCALSVVVPNLRYQKVLNQTGREILSIPAQAKGTVIRYSCSMGMYTGQLIFDQE